MVNVSLHPLGLAVPFADIKAAVAWAQRSVTVYGKTLPQPRLTRWYGDVPYVYSNLSWEPAPMPALVESIRVRVQEITGEKFNSVLCNLYRGGQDSVGWHADDEPIFGGDPIVASLTFGAQRKFALRSNDGKVQHEWWPRDGELLVMGKGIQPNWKHSLPKTSKPMGERINLTFRQTI